VNVSANGLADRVVATLASVKHIPPETISLEARLEDLKVDSLDRITLLFELEKAFDIAIPDEQLAEVRTVADMVAGVERLVAARKAPPAAQA
jgi:acyl carrier protein